MTRNLKIEMITKMDDTKLFCIRFNWSRRVSWLRKIPSNVSFAKIQLQSKQKSEFRYEKKPSKYQNSFTWTAAHQKTLALVDSEVCRKRSSLNR